MKRGYRYKDEDGNVIFRVFAIGKQPRSIMVNGNKFESNSSQECNRPTSIAGNWPMVSTAAGVAASQATEAMVEAKQMGVPTDFTPDGDAIFTSRQHRKRYCQAVGLHDRNGGYSDP